MKPHIKAAAISAIKWTLGMFAGGIVGRILVRWQYSLQIWDNKFAFDLAISMLSLPFIFAIIFAWKLLPQNIQKYGRILFWLLVLTGVVLSVVLPSYVNNNAVIAQPATNNHIDFTGLTLSPPPSINEEEKTPKKKGIDFTGLTLSTPDESTKTTYVAPPVVQEAYTPPPAPVYQEPPPPVIVQQQAVTPSFSNVVEPNAIKNEIVVIPTPAPVSEPMIENNSAPPPKKHKRKYSLDPNLDLRYCLEIKNVVEFDKCINQ
jgi:hypothetical protein